MVGEREVFRRGEDGHLPIEQRPSLSPELIQHVHDRLSRATVTQSIFHYMVENFGRTVSREDIITEGLQERLVGTWRGNLMVGVRAIRAALPDEYALYSLHSHGRHRGIMGLLFSRRFPVGSQLLPDYLEEQIGDVSDAVYPLLKHYNSADVEENDRLALRLSDAQLVLLNHLGSRYPHLVNSSELIELLWPDYPYPQDRKISLWAVIQRLRDNILQFADGKYILYNLHKHEKYLLSPRLAVGRWFIPPDRNDAIQSVPKKVQPLAEFCSQVRVMNSNRLKSRLSPIELSLFTRLASSYPDLVEHTSLVRKDWGYIPVDHRLWNRVGRLRRMIRHFESGAFDVDVVQGIGYRLVHREQ